MSRSGARATAARRSQRPARRAASAAGTKAPAPAALDRADRRYLVHGFASPAVTADRGTLTLVRGRGVYVWDSDGRRYLDGLSGLWNVSIGHGRAEIARRVAAQIRQLAFAPTLLGFSSPPPIELAARLARLAPKGMSRVVFTSGGSEANETVIRLVRLYWRLRGYTDKVKIVALERAYHGSSTGAATLTGLPYFHRYYEPMLPGVERIANPYCYRCPLGRTYPECGIACADELQRLVEREGSDRIAAFIAEPVQGVGGVIVPPPEYFERIRAICDRNHILLVADEVITGFGRLGRAFAMQRWKVTPDLISFAKGVSSGYLPLGGVILRDEIYQAMVDAGPEFSLHHGFTYSGHPVACTAALANLDIMEREDLFAQSRRKERHFCTAMRGLGELAAVGQVRAVGLMAAIELVADRQRKTPFAAELAVSAKVRQAALRRGLIVRGSGDNVVVCPPLIIEPRQIDWIAETLRLSIAEACGEVRGVGY